MYSVSLFVKVTPLEAAEFSFFCGSAIHTSMLLVVNPFEEGRGTLAVSRSNAAWLGRTVSQERATSYPWFLGTYNRDSTGIA